MTAADLPPGILELLQKMQQMTVANGCTPSEAAFAADRVAAILAKHQLSIADIPARKVGEDVIERDIETGHSVIPNVARTYAAFIADAWRCRLLSSRSFLRFVGHGSDVACATFFFETTYRRVRAHGKRIGKQKGYRKQRLRDYADDFTQYAGEAVRDRMRHYGGEANQALVCLKEQRVAEHLHRSYPDTEERTGKVKSSRDAKEMGLAYGRSMEIAAGIEGQATPAIAAAGQRENLFD